MKEIFKKVRFFTTIFLLLFIIGIVPTKVLAADSTYSAGKVDEYGKTEDGYYIYSDSDHRIKLGSCYFFRPLEPYRKQTLWYSKTKTGKAYKLFTANLDKGVDFGDYIFCNDKYIFFNVTNSNKNKSYIYRVEIATNKKEQIVSFKGVVLDPIIKIYDDKLYFKRKPMYKLDEATTSYISCIDLTDKSYEHKDIDQFEGNYNTFYVTSKKDSRYFWIAKIYDEHDRTDGINGTVIGRTCFGVYDAVTGEMIKEIDNNAIYRGAEIVHVDGKLTIIDREVTSDGKNKWAFYTCDENGDNMKKIATTKEGYNDQSFNYQGIKGSKILYSINVSDDLYSANYKFWTVNVNTGKITKASSKDTANYKFTWGPQK